MTSWRGLWKMHESKKELRNSKLVATLHTTEKKGKTENRKLINPASVANLNRAWKKCCTRKVSKTKLHGSVCLVQEGNVKFLLNDPLSLPRCDLQNPPSSKKKDEKEKKEKENAPQILVVVVAIKMEYFSLFWRKHTFLVLFSSFYSLRVVFAPMRERDGVKRGFFLNKIVCLHNNNNS